MGASPALAGAGDIHAPAASTGPRPGRGCEHGHHAQVLSKRGNEVTAIDLSEAMLVIARRRVRLVSFAYMDIQALSFPPATFDAIWCAATAIHVPREEIGALLRGFRRTLRPNGILGINMQVGRASEIVDYCGDRRFFSITEIVRRSLT